MSIYCIFIMVIIIFMSILQSNTAIKAPKIKIYKTFNDNSEDVSLTCHADIAVLEGDELCYDGNKVFRSELFRIDKSINKLTPICNEDEISLHDNYICTKGIRIPLPNPRIYDNFFKNVLTSNKFDYKIRNFRLTEEKVSKSCYSKKNFKKFKDEDEYPIGLSLDENSELFVLTLKNGKYEEPIIEPIQFAIGIPSNIYTSNDPMPNFILHSLIYKMEICLRSNNRSILDLHAKSNCFETSDKKPLLHYLQQHFSTSSYAKIANELFKHEKNWYYLTTKNNVKNLRHIRRNMTEVLNNYIRVINIDLKERRDIFNSNTNQNIYSKYFKRIMCSFELKKRLLKLKKKYMNQIEKVGGIIDEIGDLVDELHVDFKRLSIEFKNYTTYIREIHGSNVFDKDSNYSELFDYLNFRKNGYRIKIFNEWCENDGINYDFNRQDILNIVLNITTLDNLFKKDAYMIHKKIECCLIAMRGLKVRC